MFKLKRFRNEKEEIIGNFLVQVKDLRKIIELEKEYPNTLKNINLENLDDDSFIEINDHDLYSYLYNLTWMVDYDLYDNFSITELEIAINSINMDIAKLRLYFKKMKELNVNKEFGKIGQRELEKLKFQKNELMSILKQRRYSEVKTVKKR